MNAIDFIRNKKNREEHKKEDIKEFISNYVDAKIPDYQVAAWLMAVNLNGMSEQETADLTDVMANSGDINDLSMLEHTVDKHSTGGVGDKTSLVLGPLLATMGATVAKMSGRGLGHTGGTIDKLESIPGFKTSLSDDQFLTQAKNIGLVISGQSKELAPADGKLYALRDATATVQSLPLIASSIMSKKLAGGAKSIVLDVKTGKGAFMKTIEDARELAKAMISIGKHNGRNMKAVITNMEEPLGFAVGNALEVYEAIETLQGKGPADLSRLCVTLASQVLQASGLESNEDKLNEIILSGRAYSKFEEWVEAQGANPEDLIRLQVGRHRLDIKAEEDGFVQSLDATVIGNCVKVLGGGRKTKEDEIDHGVGVIIAKKIGDYAQKGDVLLTIFHNNTGLEDAITLAKSAYHLGENRIPPKDLILEIL